LVFLRECVPEKLTKLIYNNTICMPTYAFGPLLAVYKRIASGRTGYWRRLNVIFPLITPLEPMASSLGVEISNEGGAAGPINGAF